MRINNIVRSVDTKQYEYISYSVLHMHEKIDRKRTKKCAIKMLKTLKVFAIRNFLNFSFEPIL